MARRSRYHHACFECGKAFELERMVRVVVQHRRTGDELEFLMCADCALAIDYPIVANNWDKDVEVWFRAP